MKFARNHIIFDKLSQSETTISRREKISRTFDQYLIEQLQDPDEAKAHLELAIDEFFKDGDSEAFMLMLRLVAEAQGGIAQL